MTWSPKWLHRHKCSKCHAWIIWNTLKSHKRTCSIMQCQEKFLWSPKMETGPPTLPIEWRIKPGESSGSGGSDVRGNISAKGIGWGKNHEGEKRTIYNWGTQIGQFGVKGWSGTQGPDFWVCKIMLRDFAPILKEIKWHWRFLNTWLTYMNVLESGNNLGKKHHSDQLEGSFHS